jgi:L-lactate dehydrogenase complex protein LldG
MNVSSSREIVLERIRAATAGSAERNAGAADGKAAEAHAEIPREYLRQGQMSASARCQRFVERLREYDAEVVECEPGELPATITAVLAASGRHRFVAPPGIPPEWYVEAAWKIAGFACTFDHGLEIREIEQAEGVLTACFCGVAESGTIVLHHGPAEGRRVLSLLPDWHLCVVRRSQVVETLPEYFDRSANSEPRAEALPKLVTWIAGPSATADIEMTRIKGVHGPRFLNVIVVRD